MHIGELGKLIHEHRGVLARRYQVQRLALLDPETVDSLPPRAPVRLLVEFAIRPTIKSYRGLQLHLEDLLQAKILLVTPEVLNVRGPADGSLLELL